MIKVYHMTSESRKENTMSFCGLDGFENFEHEFVAQVDTDSLEEAFNLTNHIDYDWRKNKNIKKVINKECVNSTSVGDLMVYESTKFLVDFVGFKRIY